MQNARHVIKAPFMLTADFLKAHDPSPTLTARLGNGRQLTSTLQLQCFNMAARLAVRSENKLELEKESLSANTLNLKPSACSGDYTGKPNLSHKRRMSALGPVTDRHTG